ASLAGEVIGPAGREFLDRIEDGPARAERAGGEIVRCVAEQHRSSGICPAKVAIPIHENQAILGRHVAKVLGERGERLKPECEESRAGAKWMPRRKRSPGFRQGSSVAARFGGRSARISATNGDLLSEQTKPPQAGRG